MKLVILDRDGVINHDSDEFIKSPDEWIPLPGSLEAIARLCRADYKVVVATNQSGIARGLFDTDMLNKIHMQMLERVHQKGGQIDAIFFCPHGPDDDCACRKPRPGMLNDIAERLNVNLAGVPIVGDSLRDIQSAQAVDALPVLVRSGKGERTLKKLSDKELSIDFASVPVFKDLAEFAEELLDGRLAKHVVQLFSKRGGRQRKSRG